MQHFVVFSLVLVMLNVAAPNATEAADVQAAAGDASKSDSSGAAPDAYRIGPDRKSVV